MSSSTLISTIFSDVGDMVPDFISGIADNWQAFVLLIISLSIIFWIVNKLNR